MPILPTDLQLRQSLERMHRQAFEYAAFAKRAATTGDTSSIAEPPPLSLSAVETLEAQLAARFDAGGLPFVRFGDFRRDYAERVPHPGVGLFGEETAQSLAWVYGVLYRWLDQQLASLAGLSDQRQSAGDGDVRADCAQSFQTAILRALWPSSRRLRVAVAVIAGFTLVCFSVWLSLPDDLKTALIRRLLEL